MFFLDLKRAGVAIDSGRLDEAFQVLHSSDERQHRDGQTLVDRLTDAYIARSTQHLAADRNEDARHDGNKALQLAGRKPEVTQLLKQISVAAAERQHRQQRHQEVVKSARQQIDAGAYSIGAKLLDSFDGNSSAAGQLQKEQLADSIDAKKLIVANAATRLQTLIDAEDFESAADMLAELPFDQLATPAIPELVPSVLNPLVENGFSELHAGRLDRVAAIDTIVTRISTRSQRAEELHQSLTQCREAPRLLLDGQL